MGESSIQVSVVIVTYNRADELTSLLASLETDLARPNVELIVVDDGSTDDTADRIEPTVAPLGERARLIRQANSGPGAARNVGILAARGDVVVFVDTDCVVQPEWFDSLIAPFEDAGVGGVGGPDRSSPDDPLFSRFIDYLMTSFITTGGVRGGKKLRGGTYHPRSFNMAVRRESAVAVGGFPTIWYGEDVLLSWRISQSGKKLSFAEGAWVYHKRRTSVTGWARQIYRMGRARWWMARHDRRLMQPVYMAPLAEWAVGIGLVSGIVIGDIAVAAACIVVLGVVGHLVSFMGLDGWRKTKHPLATVALPLMFLLRESAYALGSLAGMVTRMPDLDGALSRASVPEVSEPAGEPADE